MQTLDSQREFINEHSSLDRTLEIGDELEEDEHQDMELEDLNSDRNGHGQYLDFPKDSDASSSLSQSNQSNASSIKSVPNATSKDSRSSQHNALSFGFHFDSQGTPSLMQDIDTSAMVLGDLEMVAEEPELDCNELYSKFMGIDSDRVSSPLSSLLTKGAEVAQPIQSNPPTIYQKEQIQSKLEKLKKRGKRKRQEPVDTDIFDIPQLNAN